MTLSQFVETVRRRHRAESDSNWADREIYQLATGRCNEILSIIGLLEDTDTSNTSTASTQAYAFPSDAVRIKQVDYKGVALREISFREWQLLKNQGIDASGLPTEWVNWNREIMLVPIPDTSSEQITIYYEKEHPYIGGPDGTTNLTIDIPAVMHFRLADGVIADMFDKDLNANMSDRYEQRWQQKHIPAFMRYAQRSKRGGRARIINDADSVQGHDYGIV